jgi:hypothetical protein
VGPRAGLDTVVKRKILSLCRDSSPPIIKSVKNYTLPAEHFLLDHNYNKGDGNAYVKKFVSQGSVRTGRLHTLSNGR